MLPPRAAGGRPAYPINLATALELAQARSLDVQVAAERINLAAADLDRARSRWLPTLAIGGDYGRHDGHIQDIVGTVFPTSRSSLMVGVGPALVFSPSEAILAPLAARQMIAARESGLRATENDITLAVAEAYFAVQRARGELSGALEAERLATDLVQRAEKLGGLGQPVEVNRARTEQARRAQTAEAARERWETASADLNRLLRLPASLVVDPFEPPDLRVQLFDSLGDVDELIALALTNRPELAAQQATVQATIARLRQEKMRLLIPSVIVRGNATNPGGSLSTGYFGGGVNSDVTNFGWRNSMDVQVLWELQGLGLGNRAGIREREAESRIAGLELFRTQDQIAAEVAQAHAQVTRAALRANIAETGLGEAVVTVKTNLDGLSQTRRIGETLVLVFRPQEVVAAIQALAQAYQDYFGAVADVNRAQFRLYRALGHPARCVLARPPASELPVPAARLVLPEPATGGGEPPSPIISRPTPSQPDPGSGFAADRQP